MRSVFKLSLLAAALTALVAGNAFAQLSGDVSVAFGQKTTNDAAQSPYAGGGKLEGYGEFNLRGAGGEGALTGGFRMRIRKDKSLSAGRMFMNYALSDALSIRIHGSSYGNTGIMGNADRSAFHFGGVAENEADNDDTVNNQGVSVIFKGPVTAEAGIFTSCGNCPGVAKDPTTGDALYVRAGSQSIMLGVEGSAGAISYNAMILNAGSKDVDATGTTGTLPDMTPKTAFMGFGVGFAGGAFNVNLDYSSLKVNAGCDGCEDAKKDAVVLGLDAAGGYLSYASITDTAPGADTSDKEANIILGYKFVNTPKGHMAAEYRSQTNTPGGGGDAAVTTAILVGATTKF